MVVFSKWNGERSLYSLHGEAERDGRRRVVTELQGTSGMSKVMGESRALWRPSETS